jgi:hypothetical protein
MYNHRNDSFGTIRNTTSQEVDAIDAMDYNQYRRSFVHFEDSMALVVNRGLHIGLFNSTNESIADFLPAALPKDESGTMDADEDVKAATIALSDWVDAGHRHQVLKQFLPRVCSATTKVAAPLVFQTMSDASDEPWERIRVVLYQNELLGLHPILRDDGHVVLSGLDMGKGVLGALLRDRVNAFLAEFAGGRIAYNWMHVVKVQNSPIHECIVVVKSDLSFTQLLTRVDLVFVDSTTLYNSSAIDRVVFGAFNYHAGGLCFTSSGFNGYVDNYKMHLPMIDLTVLRANIILGGIEVYVDHEEVRDSSPKTDATPVFHALHFQHSTDGMCHMVAPELDVGGVEFKQTRFREVEFRAEYHDIKEVSTDYSDCGSYPDEYNPSIESA